MKPSSLAGSIVASLRAREMSPTLPDLLLTPDRRQVLRHDETEYWDYKQELSLDKPAEVANFVRDILGFHNSQGGVLVVGVTNDFRVVGVPRTRVLDTNRLHQKIRKFIGPELFLFQDQIVLPNRRVLWLIFVPRRQAAPVPVAHNGPATGNGSYLICRNDYYVRVGDEVKRCIDPADYERLFSGVRLDHLQAYVYEVDEPFFRLLSPHCDEFVGRTRLLMEVSEALQTRHPVVALDGSGGVGKTAIAIEVMRHRYAQKNDLFLICLSAKSKVWHGYVSSRKAGFSGFTEMLLELSRVLQLPPQSDPEAQKRDVIEAMAGCEGVLLVDNLEDVDDPAVVRFLSREVPAPVKVLVTSRIDKNLGALTISVPEMHEDEARALLFHELERVGYRGYIGESAHVQEILAATGRLPLALKWAAGLAASCGSLKEASRRLRTTDASKREFLNFCFATMYDALTPLGRDLALLCTYLGEEWNVPTACVALDRSESELERAFQELKDRGIVFAAAGGLSMLPLTSDFLSSKWHEADVLRKEVTARLAEAIGSAKDEGLLLNWPVARRVEVLRQRARELMPLEPERAGRLVRLALGWAQDAGLRYLEGRSAYLSGQRQDGLSMMRVALGQAGEAPMVEERLLFAESLLRHGGKQGQREALQLAEDTMPRYPALTQEQVTLFVEAALEIREYRALRRLLDKLQRPQHVHWMLKAMLSELEGVAAWVTASRKSLLRALKLAQRAGEVPEAERYQALERRLSGSP